MILLRTFRTKHDNFLISIPIKSLQKNPCLRVSNRALLTCMYSYLSLKIEKTSKYDKLITYQKNRKISVEMKNNLLFQKKSKFKNSANIESEYHSGKILGRF